MFNIIFSLAATLPDVHPCDFGPPIGTLTKQNAKLSAPFITHSLPSHWTNRAYMVKQKIGVILHKNSVPRT